MQLILFLATALNYLQVGSVHVLEVDPHEYEISIVKCHPREKTSEVAKRYDAEAAVNGGFFKVDGISSGILQIQGLRFSDTDRCRGAIGWTDGTDALIDRLDSDKEGTLLPYFHPENAALWNEMENILGATPVLIMDGEIPANFLDEKVIQSFLFSPHARTAIGLKEDGTWVFAMIQAPGFLMMEWANFFKSLQCKYALNLDGGSSSTLYSFGKVIYGKAEEIEVGNVLIIKQRLFFGQTTK